MLFWLAGAIVFALLAPMIPPGTHARAASAPQRTVAIGVDVAGDDNAADLSAYTTAAGVNPSIVMWYQSWGEPLYWSAQMPWDDAVGATPMITWDPANSSGGIPLADIAAGDYNTYIDQSAQLAKSYRKPMLIRFAHEMNISSSSWGPGHNGNSPAEFVAAWRYVVNRFASDGVTNVRWVWSPNVSCNGHCPFDAYYPGNAWVDYVALDGYNYSSVDNVAWMSFDKIFSASYEDITALSSKPVIIAETASVEAGGNKAAWITYTFQSTLPTLYPRVVAVVWFDRIKEADWRVNSSSASLAAWQQVVASPRYNTTFASAVTSYATSTASNSTTPGTLAATPTPTASATPTPSAAPTVGTTPTPTAAPTVTPTESASPKAASGASPSTTASPTPSSTHAPTPTPTLTATHPAVPTVTPTAALSPTPTAISAPPPTPSSSSTPATTAKPASSPSHTSASLRIGHVKYAPTAHRVRANQRLNSEYLTLRNLGSAPMSTGGWTITDAAGHRFRLPAWTLHAHAALIVHVGRGRDHGRQAYMQRRSPIWHSNRDRLRLTDRTGKWMQTCAWHHRERGSLSCRA